MMCRLCRFLRRWRRRFCGERRAVTLNLRWQPVLKSGGSSMLEAKISAVEDLLVTPSPTDAAGNPAPIENLRITSSDGSVIAGGEPGEDGSVRCVSAGLGSATLTVTADADLGEGVEEI